MTASIDIIICLGGDGTLLYASSLFERSIPPIMSFNLGSLGFLTPFNFGEFTENLESLFKDGFPLKLICYLTKHFCN